MKNKNKNNKIISDLFDKIDDKTFNSLIEKQYKENYTYFYKIAYSVLENDADAEDAVTESFIKLYKHREKISKKKCPEITPYLVSIVRNLSIDMKKAQSKIFFSEELIDSVAFSESVETILFKMLENQELYQLLDILNETEYDIFEFRVIEKLTFKEIAQELDMSEEATKKKYQRLIKKLREEKERRSK